MRGILKKVIVAMTALSVVGGAVRAQGTACDSPCKFILLPLVSQKNVPVPNSNPLSELQEKLRSGDLGVTPEPYQLQRLPTPVPGSPLPVYPDSLKRAGVEGLVVASFQVDTLGKVDLNTVQIEKATHQLFAIAVLDVLGRMQFSPPEINGIKVRRSITYPFAFNIAH
jgi:TonB family protein